MTGWVHVHNKDELEAFYRGVLPNIITEAKYHGYAIGLHGSLRRDLDLIAVPWSDDHSDKDDLARAIHEAACGMPQTSYQWEKKPCGRIAVSFPVCWTERSEAFPNETNLGHIDLSVMVAVRPEEKPHVCSEAWFDRMADTCPACREKPKSIEALTAEILSMPRYDCCGPEGDYNAGMEPGDGYVDYYELEKILNRYASSPLDAQFKETK